MKINAVITRQPNFRLREKKTGQNERSLFLLTGVTAAGIILGVLIYLLRRTWIVPNIIKNFVSFETGIGNGNFPSLLLGFSSRSLLFCAVLFLLGTSVLGQPLIYGTILLKCTGLGVLACFFVQNYEAQGIGYYFLCQFPGKVLFLFAVLLMGQNCLFTSREIRKTVLEEGSQNKRLFRLYAVRSAISALIFFLSSLLDTVMIQLFSHLFSLQF